MASSEITLYYYPVSSCSQKVLLALLEKKASFSKVSVNIHGAEQAEAWFMKINPKGQVPVLKCGKEIIIDSEAIIDYVDEKVKTGAGLVPDKSTKLGQAVDQWRKKIVGAPIGMVTFGVFLNREFSVSGVKITGSYPLASADATKTMMKNNLQTLKEQAERNPELRETYMTKVSGMENFFQNLEDKEKVKMALTDLQRLLDDVENQLKETQNEQGTPDAWLLGKDFSAADITLAILLDRIVLLGLEDDSFTKDKRPVLFNYYKKLGQRDNIKVVRDEVERTLTKHV